MFRSIRPVLASFAVCALVACSSGESEPFNPDSGVATGLVTPKNAHWCSAQAPASCAAVNVCGVCVPKPTAELTRTTDTKEYKGTGPADASCFDVAKPPTPVGESKTVKMKGWVKIFANGPDSKNVKIEVYEEELDASGLATGKLGKLVGTATSNDKVEACSVNPAFPCWKEETKLKSGIESKRSLYPYELDGVPTEKPLIVRTSDAITDAGWLPLYDFNVAARNDKLNMAGEYEYDVRALGNDDYATIMKAAYNQPPQGGEAAIAGEVHDCGDVRVSKATVGIEPKTRFPLVYLAAPEDDPKPDTSALSTSPLGLYAVGGAKPGIYTVAASGLLGGEVVALGTYKVQTFENAVSVFTFRGIRPWQVPKK